MLLTRPTAATRRPGQPRPGRRSADCATRRTRALASLGLAIAGPPILLLILAGDPLRVPAPVRTLQLLQAPVTDEVLLWLLAAFGWLLWLHLLGSTVVELGRQTRGSTWRMPLPGLLFGANTALASHLVATLLLAAHPSVGSAALLTPARSAVALAATAPWPVVGPTGPVPPPGGRLPGAVRSAEHRDTRSARPAPASQSESVSTSTVQCRVLPPAGRHHDTLWGIAERHLGDGLRWREIYLLNENRLMPDGQRLTRASLIRPGWVLHLPADATALALDQVLTHPDVDRPHHELAAPVPAAPDHLGVADHPGRAAADPPAHRPAAGSTSTPSRRLIPVPAVPPSAVAGGPPPSATTADPPVAADPPAPPAGTGAGSGGAAPASARPGHAGAGRQVPSLAAGGLGLAAIAVLAALVRRRKLAARRRRPGTRPAAPPAELTATEAELRRAARAATEVAATVRLALLLASRHAPGATVKAVWQHPDGSLELVLAQPGPPQAVPAPFEPTSRGWLLPAAGLRFLFATSRSTPIGDRLAEELQQAVDPFPLLVPVGSCGGSACYVNLEALGLVSLLAAAAPVRPDPGGPSAGVAAGDAADPDSQLLAEAVLGALVHALTGAPWAELMRLAVAPRFAELAVGLDRIDVLHPELLTRLVATADVTAEADGSATGAVDAAAGRVLAGYPSVAAARRADPDGAGIIGTVVLAGLTPEQAPTSLVLAATRPTVPLVMLLLGPHPDAHRWQLHPDGTLAIPGIADALQPLRHDPNQHARQLRLLEHAEDPPHAAPDDPGTAARTADCPPATSAPELPPDPSPVHRPATDPEAGGDADQVEVIQPVDLTGTAQPEPAVPTATAATGTVEVAILGPLLITGPDTTNPRPQLNQLLVYLALHRRPVASERLWEAVWPDRTYNGHTLRNRMSDLRAYIGQHVSYQAKAWQLTDGVGCDWARFQALAVGGPDHQLAALALVRGRPFQDTPNDWIHLEGQHAEIEAAVVDLALLVGQRALDSGEFDTARAAATAGLLGCPYDERLYQLGMKAAAGRGATGEIRALRRQLEQTLDEELEPDDSLLAGTKQLYQELLDAERTHRP